MTEERTEEEKQKNILCCIVCIEKAWLKEMTTFEADRVCAWFLTDEINMPPGVGKAWQQWSKAIHNMNSGIDVMN